MKYVNMFLSCMFCNATLALVMNFDKQLCQAMILHSIVGLITVREVFVLENEQQYSYPISVCIPPSPGHDRRLQKARRRKKQP